MKKPNYTIVNAQDILHSVSSFCDYYGRIKKYIDNNAVISSVDRGAFVRPQDVLDEHTFEMLGSKRNSLSYAYGPERGDTEILELLAAVENRRHGTTYTQDNIALVPGAWGGVNLVLEEVFALKRGKLGNKKKLVVIGPTHYQLFHRAINFLGIDVCAFNYVNNPSSTTPSDFDDIERYLDFRPAAIFLANPNNPNGVFFDLKFLKRLITRAKESGVVVIIDEIQSFFPSLDVDDLKYGSWIQSDNVVRIDSFSKKRGIAEYRVGWVIADKSLLGSRTTGVIGRMSGFIGNAPRAANTALYYLLSRELEGNDTCAAAWQSLREREQFVVESLSQFSEIQLHPRDACINLVIEFSSWLTDIELSEMLMNRGVLMLPCSGYGYRPNQSCLRFTFAERFEKLEFAIKMLGSVIDHHRAKAIVNC